MATNTASKSVKQTEKPLSSDEWETLNIKPRSVEDVRDFSSLHQAQRELGTQQK
jgi:hypothetical protein